MKYIKDTYGVPAEIGREEQYDEQADKNVWVTIKRREV